MKVQVPYPSNASNRRVRCYEIGQLGELPILLPMSFSWNGKNFLGLCPPYPIISGRYEST